MQISSQNTSFQPLEPLSTQSNTKASSDAAAPAQSSTPASDAASLGSGQMLSGDDVRMGMVQSLQSQITGGTYQVSAQAVASKLVDSMIQG
jgi:flagellar biosynthesis anti-sigma factor FlgM